MADTPMVSFAERIVRRAASRHPKRKLAVGLVGLGTLLAVAAYAGRPRYAPLFEGLSDVDVARVVAELRTGGEFAPRVGPRGVVEVPASRIPEARVRLAMAGRLPRSSSPSESPLDSILEGEIARTLETVRGVASARVRIARPKERLFTSDDVRPKASVVIVERGARVSGRTVANLVCASIDGLTPMDVVVVSATRGELWSGADPRPHA